MKKGLVLIVIFFLSACTNSKINSDRIFSNAQVLYQKKEQNAHVKETELQMPSYFLELEYKHDQTRLSDKQIKKIETIFKKLVYPDEYRMYASFGANVANNQMASFSNVFKRAADIKKRYGKRVKEVKVAYLKNQKSDCVYIRLLG